MAIDRDHHGARVNRRHVICGGGAALFGAMIPALLGSTKPVRAASISGAVPEVDGLAVRVVIDSYQFAVAPSRKVDGVEIQHFGWGIGGDRPPGKTLISEFGLSMHVESRRGAETRQLLLDFGFTPQALVNNTELLGIDPSALDALVLSHGHYDHFGGMVNFLRQHKGTLRAGLPLYVGGEDCFCARRWTAPPTEGNFGAIDRAALEEAKLSVIYAEGPSLIAGHGFTTGQINLDSFERLLSPSTMKVGVDGGVGCYADKLPENERSKIFVPDQFRHEIGIAFNLKGRGLVVLTACSHRGVVNAVRQAQRASGVDKVHVVMGGFHLAPYEHEYVRQTLTALEEMDVGYVIPLHCTGEPFYEMARGEMPTRLLRSYTGTRFVFGA